MHLSEIQLANRKVCRGAGSAPSIVLHPSDNRYNVRFLYVQEKI